MIAGSIIFSAGCALTHITINKVRFLRLHVIFIVNIIIRINETIILMIIAIRNCGWWRQLMVLCQLLVRTLHSYQLLQLA